MPIFLKFLAQRQRVHPCQWPVWPCSCLCQLNCLPDKQSLARTLCSWTFPSQEGIIDTDHVAFIDRLSRRIKTLISNVHPYGFSCRNTNALIHSHMYPQSNPVSWNKKAALLSWGLQKFMHFSSARFGRARLLMKAWLKFLLWPHPGWSIC